MSTYDRTSINSWEDTQFKQAVKATSRKKRTGGLRRVEQAGAKLISRVQMYCELQRDWARKATVPGFMDVFESFEASTGRRPKRPARPDQGLALMMAGAPMPAIPSGRGEKQMSTFLLSSD